MQLPMKDFIFIIDVYYIYAKKGKEPETIKGFRGPPKKIKKS